MTNNHRVPVRISPIRFVERDSEDWYCETWEYDVEYDDGITETITQTRLR